MELSNASRKLISGESGGSSRTSENVTTYPEMTKKRSTPPHADPVTAGMIFWMGAE